MAFEDTGERLVPESSDPDLRDEHLARYCFAEPLAGAGRVLDAGCGTGYGAARLARAGSTVFALDRAAEPMRYGRPSCPGVSFVQGDCAALPFPDESLDLVVAFEVIEHLTNWAGLVAEAARVLAPSGALVISTPNREYYQSSREEPNPFHVREFDYNEFRFALEGPFRHSRVYLENHAPAIAFTSLAAESTRAHFEGSAPDPASAHFFVAVCTKRPLALPPDFAFVSDSGNVLRERELHLAKLEEWIGELEARHAAIERRMSSELSHFAYRILRFLGLAPRLPDRWSG